MNGTVFFRCISARQKREPRVKSSLLSTGLAVHFFDDDIVDFAEGGAVCKHLPRLVRVEMDLDLNDPPKVVHRST